MNCLILLLLLCCGDKGFCGNCGSGNSSCSCKCSRPCPGEDSCGCGTGPSGNDACGCVPPRPEPRNDCRMDRRDHDSCGDARAYTPFPSPGSTCGCEEKQ